MHVITKDAQTVDGTGGGNISISPYFSNTQITISGRTSGTISFDLLSNGGDSAKTPTENYEVDLSSSDTLIISGASLKGATLTPDSAGNDMEITVSQW
jgi:hypothetical protein